MSGWSLPEGPSEVKHLNLKAEDVEVLMQLRAVYMCQLLISLTSSTASNLQSLFGHLKNEETLTQLAALDACFVSFENMFAGWTAALQDLSSRGSCDSKVVLTSIGARPVNAGSKKILGDAVAKGDLDQGQPTSDRDQLSDVIAWNSLLSFGCSPDVLSSEGMLELQLSIQTHLLKHAGEVEAPFRNRLRLHVAQPPETGTSRRSSTSLPFTLLWELQEEDRIHRSPASGVEYAHIPQEFQLVFFGVICHSDLD